MNVRLKVESAAALVQHLPVITADKAAGLRDQMLPAARRRVCRSSSRQFQCASLKLSNHPSVLFSPVNGYLAVFTQPCLTKVNGMRSWAGDGDSADGKRRGWRRDP